MSIKTQLIFSERIQLYLLSMTQSMPVDQQRQCRGYNTISQLGFCFARRGWGDTMPQKPFRIPPEFLDSGISELSVGDYS